MGQSSLEFARNSNTFSLSPIKAMELAVAKTPGAISLAQGIPSFSTPEVIKEFVRERLAEGLCDRYSLTIGISELREEIAHQLQSGEGLTYDPDSEIIITVGSIEGITASILALTQPGDEVLIPSPSYVSYQGAIGLARCTAKFFELDEDNNFDFDVQKISQSITRNTKVILFCSPNNPTGTLFSKEKTEQLVELATRHNISILIDEVYKDFYYTNDKHFTACSIASARERIVRVCSFSKAYAMTGWRVGFLHCPRSIAQRIVKFHDAMVTCAPVISQYAALAALKFGETALKEFRQEFKRRRDYTIERLDKMSQLIDYQLPKATYFVFPRLKDSCPLARNSTAFAYDLLAKAGVAVVPGVAFGPSGESHFRISYGRDWPQLEEGLNRLEGYLLGGRKAPRQTSQQIASPSVNPANEHRSNETFLRVATQRVLHWSARKLLKRTNPKIIGIAGSRGKTVYKRTIAELLASKYNVRANPLSFNSQLGFPLAVLDLSPPKSWVAKAVFPLLLVWRLVAGTKQCDILVLEYGVDSPKDSEALLKIAVPDWLILTGVDAPEPNLPISDFQAALDRLVSAVPPIRVLLPVDENSPSQAATSPTQIVQVPFAALPTSGVEVKNATGINRVQVTRDVVGSSGWGAIATSLQLAEALGVPSAAIERFLAGR